MLEATEKLVAGAASTSAGTLGPDTPLAALDESRSFLEPALRALRLAAQMPSLLQNISHYIPLGAGMQVFQEASYQGHFPSAQPLLTLAGYAIICSVAAVRWFRW